MADVLGNWFDNLGQKTRAGVWQIFLTISYLTNSYPWARGFPTNGTGRPSVEYGAGCFRDLTSHLETQLGETIEFVVADQFGKVNGRFHQHALLATKGLDSYPRSELESWLRTRAGWSRALPFERGASFYLAKYIGQNLATAEWSLRVGQEVMEKKRVAVGGVTVATSAELPKALFHQNLAKRKR